MTKLGLKAITAATAVLITMSVHAQTVTPSFSASQTAVAVQAEITRLSGLGWSVDRIMVAAKAASVDLKTFATAAAKAGLPVASVTLAVLAYSRTAAEGLKILGEAYAGNQEALATVFSTALTTPSLMMSVAAIESSIEAGCGRDCLSSTTVSQQSTPSFLRPTQQQTTTSTFTLTSTFNGGGGTGSGKPLSPTN